MGDDDLTEMIADVEKIAFLLGKKLDITISWKLQPFFLQKLQLKI